MRRLFLVSLLIVVSLSLVHAQMGCEPILIDDFENATLDTRWYKYEGNTPSLFDSGYSGKGLNSTNNPFQYSYFWKQNLDTNLSKPFSYYNISFWYYKLSGSSQCDGGDYGNFMISSTIGELNFDDPDGEWKIFQHRFDGPNTNYGLRSCNEWLYISLAIGDYDWENWNSNISADHLGLFGFEITQNPDTTVYFDEIMLIPKIPCCQENWQCGIWTSCTPEGYQTRDCFDLNDCGTTYNKSAEIQNCTYSPPVPGCEPDWACYDWGVCVNDIQERICYDKHECNTLQGQPQTSRPCVTPTLSIHATSNSSFERTDTIAVSGNVTDEFGALKTSDVVMKISSGSFSKTYQQTNVSQFDFSHLIQQTEPTGTWTIEINATDGTDVGFWSREISVFEASIFKTYNVVFTSPDEGTPYNRGEIVNIIVRVEQGETNIEGADVFIYVSNQRVNLTETTPGTYFTTYILPYDTPLGTLPISVRAEEGDVAGTSTVNIYVLPATMDIVLTTTGTTAIGLESGISANVKYPDGTPVSGLNLSISTPNGSIPMDEISPGVYSASYIPISTGTWELELGIQDAYANIGSKSSSVSVTEVGIIDLLLRYWYFIVIAVVVVVVIAYPLSKRRETESRYNELVEEGRRIIKMQEELQKSYFELNEIDIQTFKQKSAEYEKRLTQIREEVEKLKPGEVE